MTTNGDDARAFFDRYNVELEHAGCGVRVAATGRSGWMAIVDLDGKTVGDLPVSIEPKALEVIMLLIEQSFEEGVETGRALERASG